MVNESDLAELRAAKAAWKCAPERGYLLTFAEDSALGPHRMAGVNSIPGAGCPNCNKPLLRLLTLDTSQLPFRLIPSPPPFIHLLYCWTCAIPYAPLVYRLDAEGGVELLDYRKECEGAFGIEGPYDGYTGEFREVRVGLRGLTDEQEEQALIVRAGGECPPGEWYLDSMLHQIGGFPKIYNEQEPDCLVCGQPAPFLATICDNSEGQDTQEDQQKTFTGNSGVQMVFHYCGPCRVVTAYHSCD